MIANILLAAWTAFWLHIVHMRYGGMRDVGDAAALACLIVFPIVCVLAARLLP